MHSYHTLTHVCVGSCMCCTQAMPLSKLGSSVGTVLIWDFCAAITISLGDIQNLPTFWVLALFGTFYNFCFCVQTCRHLGGGGVYFLKSARKRRFTNVWVWGGRG